MLDIDIAGRQGAFDYEVAFRTDTGITALFGASGAGKTTVVRMLGGLAHPARGRIVLAGRTVFDRECGVDIPARRRRIGHVFQEPRLFPHLSVQSNLLYGRRFAARKASQQYIEHVVEMLEIGHLRGRYPRNLSGGEQQRVAIGRALLSSPEALVMDEPLASLDTHRKNEILPFLERLRDEARMPIVYVSHSVDEVARLAEGLVVLSGGRVHATGPVEDVLTKLDLRPMTGRFEAGAILEGRVTRHEPEFCLTRVEVGGQFLEVPEIELEPGQRVRIRIRARDVVLGLQPPAELSALNVLSGTVEEVQVEAGSYAEVNVRIDGQRINARITRRSAAQLALAPGRVVYAMIKTTALDRVAAARREPEA